MAETVRDKYDLVIKTLSDMLRATLYKQGKTQEAEKHSEMMKTFYEEERIEREEVKERCEKELEVHNYFYPILLSNLIF